MNATIIAFGLAVAPTDRAPPFEVADLEVQTNAESTNVIAFDSEGEVSGEIGMWVDSEGQAHLDATFADGVYMSVLVNDRGELISFESDDPASVGDRVITIEHALAELTEDETNDCLFALLAAGAGCGWGGPIGCALGAYGVHVACIRAADSDEDDQDEDSGESGESGS